MKKNVLAILLCLTGSLVQAMGFVMVTGKALPGEKVMLQMDQLQGTMISVQADDEGIFCLKDSLGQTGFYTLSTLTSRKNVPLVICSGQLIGVDLTGEQPVFSGSAVDRNQFMQTLKLREEEWAKQWPAPFDRVEAYRTSLAKRWQARRKFLAEADLRDAQFKGMLEAQGMVRYYSGLLKYPFYHQLICQSQAELPKDYYDFLAQVDLSSPWLQYLGNAASFLQELFTAMEEQGYLKNNQGNYLVTRAELIGEPQVREDYLLYVVSEVELSGYNQYLGIQLRAVTPYILTPEGQSRWKEINRKYNEQAKANDYLKAGQPAPDFTGVDANGKQHRLSDYRGQVVVVDVWNTGCKPCIAEMPYMKKLEERWKDKGVVFISYSLDTHLETWKRFLEKHHMQGHQWINTQAAKSGFSRDYQLHAIPRFMVFRKDGTIADVYAPRPSNPRLAQMIEAELKQ